uniref:tetratricopeptide repeat protein n=1 Tax=Rothia dentocariosa TaxID=2047 RepID=UPI000660598F
TAWSKIRREKEIDPKTYAQAQLGLGTAYAESGKPDQAIKTWSSISHDDDPKTYADAQLNLGNTYDDLGKLDEAIKTWSSISHDDDPETYA